MIIYFQTYNKLYISKSFSLSENLKIFNNNLKIIFQILKI